MYIIGTSGTSITEHQPKLLRQNNNVGRQNSKDYNSFIFISVQQQDLTLIIEFFNKWPTSANKNKFKDELKTCIQPSKF